MVPPAAATAFKLVSDDPMPITNVRVCGDPLTPKLAACSTLSSRLLQSSGKLSVASNTITL